MSWTDILYPSNSERRNKLAHLSGQLHTLLRNCFNAVNNLISCIEEYLPGQKFEKIAEQISLSLRENCNVIIGRVNEINAYLNTKAMDVERLIGTELFKKLMSLETTTQQKIDVAKKALTGIQGIALTVAGVILIAMIKSGKILSRFAAKLGPISKFSLATLGLAVFGLAVDLIISAILGAVERDQLENALEEYTKAVEAFEPAADGFYDDISMIRASIKSAHNG